MNSLKVRILNTTYSGQLSEDKKSIFIYDVHSEDDVDFIGEFELDGNNLIQKYSMSETVVVIGEIYVDPNESKES